MKSIRLSPSMAVAMTALVASLGGTAVATDVPAKISAVIGSAGIKNNSLTGRDIKNGSLTGKDVASNRLGGGAIKESTLGKVPSAGRADSAAIADNSNLTGGQAVRKIAARLTTGGNQGVLDLNGFQLAADCPGGNPRLIARTAVNDAYVRATVVQNENQIIPVTSGDFDTTSQLDLTGGRPVGTGTVVYSRADGAVISADYNFASLPGGVCLFAGVAVGS